MSEAYEVEAETERGEDLVADGSTAFQRAVDGLLGLCIVLFVLAAASLVQVTSLTVEVAGLTLPRLFGGVQVLVGVGLAAVGVVSRLDAVETDPSDTAGLAAGVAFAVVGSVVGIVVTGLTVGFGSPVWLLLALGVAAGFGVVTVVPREDVGSMLPASAVVLIVGAVLSTGVLDVGWVWNPAFLSGGFTGVAVIPVATMFASLVGGWGSAKARGGFGARGRELGAYYLIYANALSVIAVMVLIVLYVTKKGAGFAFQNFSIGSLAVLAILAVPLVVLGRRLYRGLDFGTRSETAKTFLQLGLFGLLGVYATASLYALVTGSVFDSLGVTITPASLVGAWLLTLVGAALTVYCWRASATARTADTADLGGLLGRFRTWFGRAAALFGLVFLANLLVPLVAPALGTQVSAVTGLALAPAAAGVALGFATLPPALAVAGADGDVAAAFDRYRPLVRTGVAAGLTLGVVAVLLEAVAGIVGAFLGLSTVPVLLLLFGLAAGLTAVVAGLLTRRTDRDLRAGTYAALGATGVVGSLTLVGLHVGLTGDTFPRVFGVTTGTVVDWPFVMRSTVPLGDQLSGILPAIVGTVWLVVGASLFAVPLGVGAAVFLTEYAEQGTFTAVVETATNALWSTPSVVFGLFGGAFIVPRLTRNGDTNLMAGMLVLGFMLLPLVLITSRESIKSVPDEYRDASAALGVSQWETIRSVVLPAAMPGIITGVILGVGRIAGETAPLILVLGSKISALDPVKVIEGFEFTGHPPFVVNTAILQESTALPTKIWAVFRVPQEFQGGFAYGWGTAFILLAVVLSFYAVGIASRRYFRRKLEHE